MNLQSITGILLFVFIAIGCSSTTSNLPAKLIRMDHFSSVNIDSRNVDIWLPPGYDEKAKYPVLYMHDGQMLFDSTTTWNGQEWGVDETITTLLTSNQIESVIIVGIWNTTKRHSEYFPQKPFESLPVSTQDSLLQLGRNENTPLFQIEIVSDLYLKFLVEELKPHIDNHYSTISGPEGTFIMGSSMGGLISMYAISEYPEIFGAAACLSTHWTGTYTDQNNPIPLAIFNYMAENLPDPTNHKLYFDYGTETLDALYEPFQQQADSVLIQAGFNTTNWTTQKFEGQGHSERAWNSRLEIPLKFLLGK